MEKVYKAQEIDLLLPIYKDFIDNKKNWKKKKKGKKTVQYLNLPMSFDIETSSFYNSNNEKQAIMYVWQFAVEDYVFIGRTWEEYDDFTKRLCEIFKCDIDKRIVVYVHNFSYEFQWIRKRVVWDDVFASEERKPIVANDIFGIEYRCSYFLSGMDLAHTAKELTSHKIEKLKGDLDYSVIHTPETPLTEKEIGYCVNDVRIITAYIAEKIEQDGSITKIPLTKTGYVRRYCRQKTLKNKSYYYNIKSLTLESEEYNLLKKAFAGGFTHACCQYVRKSESTTDNMGSFDFTSSYPTVLISEKFPMGKGKRCIPKTKKEFYSFINNGCCIFYIKLKNVKSKRKYEHYISQSKCDYLEKPIVDNGRVVSASCLTIALTNIDFKIISFCYDFEIVGINDMWVYNVDYLPKDLIECILHFYKQKTTLKGVKGKEVEYQLYKGMLNAIYGMMVTEIVRTNHIYDTNKWSEQDPVIDEAINAVNNDKKRFLFYPWGVFCTAYARYNLWTGITEFGKSGDYIYSDTDSVKVKNYDKHLQYIEKYNISIESKIKKCLSHYNIDLNEYKPKNQKGIEKPMGIWDFEGKIEYFKTLGAKRYIYKNEDGWHLTVAGTGKISSLEYLLNTAKSDDEILKMFDDDLEVPSDSTGKLTHTYIDDEITGDVVDYLGKQYHYHELSCVHLEPTSFHISMAKAFLDFLYSVMQKECVN